MNKVVKSIICIVAAVVFCYSGVQIYSILHSRSIATSHYDSYSEFVDKANQEVSTENNTDTAKDKCNISVDFKSLTAKYPDINGWLHFSNTSISYPVMQSDDNSYYLTHLPDGTENSSGSIFADYRNTAPNKDNNFIIYGHNMKNDTMFGLLDEYTSQDFYDKNSSFYYLTPKKSYKVDIVAGCIVNSDSDIYRTDLTDDELADLMKNLTAKSTFTADKSYKKGDKLITLSTCAGSSEETRYVLVGVISFAY